MICLNRTLSIANVQRKTYVRLKLNYWTTLSKIPGYRFIGCMGRKRFITLPRNGTEAHNKQNRVTHCRH